MVSLQTREFWAALEGLYEKSRFKGNQTALALEAGVSQSTVSEQLNKVKGCSDKTQGKIARAFGYDLADFLAHGRNILTGKALREKNDKPALTPTPPEEEGAALTPDALQKYPFTKRLIEEINLAAENGWSEMSVARTLHSTLEKEIIRLLELQKKENSAGNSLFIPPLNINN